MKLNNTRLSSERSDVHPVKVSVSVLVSTIAWLVCFPGASTLVAADAPSISNVTADDFNIRVSISHSSEKTGRLFESRPWESETEALQRPAAWIGTLSKASITLPRFEEQRDRLFSGWLLVTEGADKSANVAQAVTKLTSEKQRDTPLLSNNGIKGVQCIVDLDDAISLGIQQAAHNVLISQVIDLSPGSKQDYWSVDGTRIGINMGYVQHLDSVVKRLTAANVNVTLILLNSVPGKPQPGNPLIHPKTNLAEAPNHLGAFNISDEQGYLHYRAALEFLADRYSMKTKQHGLVSGYIIGNELQAHWWWYNLGEMPASEVVADYARALRIAYLSITQSHPQIRVYVSMDHHWTARMTADEGRFIPGKSFLELLNHRVSESGNFPWHIAFHPYPQNLFDPRTWNDDQAQLDFETPKITFRNLEVLSAFVRQRSFLVDGKTRRIVLSEQGFHAADGVEGERLQAAGYAYAFYRSQHVEGIDAFILHRHVDHAGEGGLKLGLRSYRPGTVTEPGEKRMIYDLFRAAGTNEWRNAFEFALPIIGIDRWEELNARPVETMPKTSPATK